MVEGVRLYKTSNGDIPREVVRAWQEFAVDYAIKNKLDTIADPERWEVPMIVRGEFPRVGLLLYQHANQLGNCRKTVILAGYDDIKKVQEKIGKLEGSVETDHMNGMAAPLHSHSKLVFDGDRFIGPVVDEVERNGRQAYRVRKLDFEKGLAVSQIYVSLGIGPKIKEALLDPSGIEPVYHFRDEATIDIVNRFSEGYPDILSRKSLESALDQHDLDISTVQSPIYSLRPGKQEQFVGYSDVPLLLGGEGEDNTADFGISLGGMLEKNVGRGFRHITELGRGEVSEPVKWHWTVAGKETSALGEISGMPHLGQGSIDSGDIFYLENYREADPLFLEFQRTKVREGH